MNFEEYAAKPLLTAAGIDVPQGRLCHDVKAVREATAAIGPSVVKAQVPTGKRGKAGGIKLANTPKEAEAAAQQEDAPADGETKPEDDTGQSN